MLGVDVRTAELVVADRALVRRPVPLRVDERAVEQVLRLPAPARVADDQVDLAVRADPHDAAVVVAAEHGHGRVGAVGHVLLQRAAAVQCLLEGQRGAVPVEAVEPVAQQRAPCPRPVLSAAAVVSLQYR